MNDRSSRAHALFILTLRQTCDATGVTRKSNLFLADLGGSEKVSKSGVKAGGSRLNQYQQTPSDAGTSGSDDPARPVQPNAAVNAGECDIEEACLFSRWLGYDRMQSGSSQSYCCSCSIIFISHSQHHIISITTTLTTTDLPFYDMTYMRFTASVLRCLSKGVLPEAQTSGNKHLNREESEPLRRSPPLQAAVLRLAAAEAAYVHQTGLRSANTGLLKRAAQTCVQQASAMPGLPGRYGFMPSPLYELGPGDAGE